MKISFVIPAYNEERYVGNCLESVLKEIKNFRSADPSHQANFEFEIIVVSNASTDKTKEVAKNYPGVIVVDEPKKGLTKARQAGLSRSTGELIANIDADTILPKRWLRKVVEEFSKNPDLICLSGPHDYYDLSPLSRFLTKIFYGFGFMIYFVNKYILKIGSLVQGGNFIVKRSALEKIGGFDTSIDFYGEDTDIARRLYPIGDVKFTFSLPIYISGRRLLGEGALKTGFKYAINYFWVSYFKKPFHGTSTDFRPNPLKRPPAN